MPDAAAAGGQALPDDVVREILARISDVATLFRCAVVCKSWCRLVADPAALAGRRWPDAEGDAGSSFPGPLLGFFVQRHRLVVNAQRKVSRLFPTRAPAFVPALGSALGPGRRFLTSFVRDDAGLLDEAKPVTARGGLLLARVSPPRAAAAGHFALHLCVCNLLTGRTDFLPPLDAACFDGEGVRGYALLTAADHGAGPHRVADGYSTFFQVILIGIHHDDRKMYVHRFSSAAAAAGSSSSAAAAGPRSWRNPICCYLLIPDNLGGPRGSRLAAVSGGTARWLFHRALSLYTLDVSATTGCVCATRLPLDGLPYVVRWDRTNVWLFQSRDDKLSLLYLENNRLYIWTQKAADQDGAMAWHLTQAVQLAAEMGLLGTESLSAVCIGEKSGAMLALYYSDPEHACMIDLSTGSMAGLGGWRRSFNYMTAVPCDDINWPVFFMSRLGGRMM